MKLFCTHEMLAAVGVVILVAAVSAEQPDPADALLFLNSNESSVDRCILVIGGLRTLFARKYLVSYEYYHPDENTTCDEVDRLPALWGEQIGMRESTACYLSATNQIVTVDTTPENDEPAIIAGVYSLNNQSVRYLPPSDEVLANGSTVSKFTSSVGGDQCVTCRISQLPYYPKAMWTETICRRYDANNPQAGWQRILPLPASIVDVAKVAVSLGDTLYVIGEDENAPLLAGVYNTLHRYEVGANRWHKEPSPLVVRSGWFAAAALSPTELLLCGGIERSCEIYDVPQRRWRITGSMNVDRIKGQLVPFNGDVYAVGGWELRLRPTRDIIGVASSSVERYNRTSERWTLVKSLPHSRFGFFTVVV